MENNNNNASDSSLHPQQKFDYLVVLDYEAVCDMQRKNWEVIEFPSVILNTKTLKVESEFQMFVKPVINVPLNHICVEITGIQQDWVDKAPLFPEVFEKYQHWLYENIIKDTTKTFCYVTCGDWDLKTMLPTQCQLSGLQSYPDYFKSWINIKDVFNVRYKSKITGMAGMLKNLKMELIGHHHSGIDDCRNITRIAVRMIEDGVVFDYTWTKDNPKKNDGRRNNNKRK
jgi:ERI1 exoribonuclease 3